MFTYRNDALKTHGAERRTTLALKRKRKKDKSETKNDSGKHAEQKIAEG